MLPTTREWVRTAEEDYDVVLLLLRSRKESRLNPIGFHCQQCVEKYLKAVLTEQGIAFPKTHDLVLLLTLVLPKQPQWSQFTLSLATLSASAVAPRYPGTSLTLVEMRQSVTACRRLRRVIRRHFELPG